MKTPKWLLLSDLKKSQLLFLWQTRDVECESSGLGIHGQVRVRLRENESRRFGRMNLSV